MCGFIIQSTRANIPKGSVVSEMVNTKASTDIYRGLHYPASDIPKQARDMYLSNKIRVLYDR